MPLSLQYVKGDGATSYFPLSAITDRLYACNQLMQKGFQVWDEITNTEMAA
jgi:hypothetical protein